MLDLTIWIALMMSLAPSAGMVWVFEHLASGGTIVGDKYNKVELIVATVILVLVVIALVGFAIRKVKGNK